MGCVISSLRASCDFLHQAGFQVGENAVHDFVDRAVALLKRHGRAGCGVVFRGGILLRDSLVHSSNCLGLCLRD